MGNLLRSRIFFHLAIGAVIVTVSGCSVPLLDAVKRNDVSSVAGILNNDINLEVVDKETGGTALYIACQKGYGQIVDQLLVKGANSGARGLGGWTPLMVAVQNGHYSICDKLLKAGASVNEKNNGGGTALLIASYHNQSDIARLLYSRGADPESADLAGWTCLHVSAENGHLEMTKFLLGAGANIESKGMYDHTPLHRAALNEHKEVFEFLLKQGARPIVIQQFHRISGITFRMLAEFHEKGGELMKASEAYEEAAQQFSEEAIACDTASRVMKQQAANERALNTILLASAFVNAYAMAATSPSGFGVAPILRHNTVDPYDTLSHAQQADQNRKWAAECHRKIKLLTE